MSTTESQIASDNAAFSKALAEKRPVDPEVLRRVRERARIAMEEIARRGPTNIAVDLIREGREE